MDGAALHAGRPHDGMMLQLKEYHRRPAWFRYGTAIAAIAVTAGLRASLTGILGETAPLILFQIPVVFTAATVGFGPALLATVVSCVAGILLFAPAGSAAAANAQAHAALSPWLARGVPFVVVGATISFLAARLDRSRVIASEIAEEARRNEGFLTRLLASSIDCIEVLDLDGNILSINSAGRRLLGMGETDSSVGSLWALRWKGGDYETALAAIAEVRAGSSATFLASTTTTAGVTRWWDNTLTAIPDRDGQPERLLSISRDVTQRQAQNEALAHAAAIVASSDDAIISKSLDGVIRSWNVGAAKLFGYSAEEMVGGLITRLFPKERLQEEPLLIDEIRAGRPVQHFETVRLSKDGRRLDVSVTLSPIRNEAGVVIGASKIARDISQRKRAEEETLLVTAERERLLASEQVLRGQAELSSKMKDEFLATLSHELRTPLSAILGWSQVLRRTPPTPETLAEGLSTIERNARAQTKIIEDLLDMSRIISGKISLDAQPINLSTVIRAAIDTVRATASAKQIRVVFSEPETARHPMSGDVNRLQQVFWNLLSNAIKFTPREGLIQVDLARHNSMWQVKVADSGEGISQDFLPYVFDRFRQADASTTRRHGGLGLGLSIVKQLVELHGGRVSVDSAGAGKGSTFSVLLPLSILHDVPAPTEDESSSPDAVKRESSLSTFHDGPNWNAQLCDGVRGLRVLIIDDEPDALRLLKQLLNDCDVEVLVAHSVNEAVEFIEHQRPDVLVSDIGMPGEDGYALVQRVRALGASRGGDVPAIALTAYARVEDRIKAVRAGFHAHVSKPVEPAELIAMIASVAQRERRT